MLHRVNRTHKAVLINASRFFNGTSQPSGVALDDVDSRVIAEAVGKLEKSEHTVV